MSDPSLLINTEQAPAIDKESVKWLRRLKSGRSSFLALILLSLANIVLTVFDASLMFPFSVFSASFMADMGSFLAAETGSDLFVIIGYALAILIISVYALLYYLARRRTWPVWTAFGLVVIDTLLLAAFAVIFDAFADSVIDILFHFLMIWSLLMLGLAHHKLTLLASEPPAVQPVEA